jgi:hypothetical protein
LLKNLIKKINLLNLINLFKIYYNYKMTCGLLQLVAYGSQDVFLTYNPQITFFKSVYRRHTNFAVEVREYSLLGNTNFNSHAYLKFNKDGDLMSNMYLKVVISKVDLNNINNNNNNNINNNFAWTRRLGHAIINKISLTLGGTLIDSQTGTWLDVWYSLTHDTNLKRGYKHLIGDVSQLTQFNNLIKPEYCLFVPLKFWFNKFIGLSVPTIAIQYHDIVLDVYFEKLENLIIYDNVNINLSNIKIKSASILVDIIYLDTVERRQFANISHEYLIDQVQMSNTLINNNIAKIKLDFNFPTKEIIYCIKQKKYNSSLKFIYYSDKDVWDLKEAATKIVLESLAYNFKENFIKISKMSNFTMFNYNIYNCSCEDIYFNFDSLILNNKHIIRDNIDSDIYFYNRENIIVNIHNVTFTIEDLSYPSHCFDDTRECPVDPIVNIFSNYGININSNNYINYNSNNPVIYSKLVFNGQDRFSKREGLYTNVVQPNQAHTNVPQVGINLFSFSLSPEEFQPSGHSNMSRIDTSELELWLDTNLDKNSTVYIFAPNYNIFRIVSGLCGLAYKVN